MGGRRECVVYSHDATILCVVCVCFRFGNTTHDKANSQTNTASASRWHAGMEVVGGSHTERPLPRVRRMHLVFPIEVRGAVRSASGKKHNGRCLCLSLRLAMIII
jgi:hypothetical protein